MGLPDIRWSDLAVPNRAVRLLDGILSSDRLPTGILLHGAPGCGKKSFGAAFIGRLHCASGDGDSCGTCNGCAMVRTQQHPDVLFVASEEGKTSISIAQIRALKEWFSLSPYQSNRRTALIDAAHQLTLEGQNALLKILEEPPGQGIIILCTSEPSGLLETIHSRIQSVFIGPAVGPEATRRVAELAGIGDSEAEQALLVAEGSIGQALEQLGDEDVERAGQGAEELLNIRVMPFGLAERQLKGADGKRLQLPEARHHIQSLLTAAMAALRPPYPHKDPALVYLAEIGEGARIELMEILVDSKRRIGANVSPRLVLERCKILSQRILSSAIKASRIH